MEGVNGRNNRPVGRLQQSSRKYKEATEIRIDTGKADVGIF